MTLQVYLHKLLSHKHNRWKALCWCLGSNRSDYITTECSVVARCFCNYLFCNIFYEGSYILDMLRKLCNPRRNQVAPSFIFNYTLKRQNIISLALGSQEFLQLQCQVLLNFESQQQWPVYLQNDPSCQ